MLDRREFTRGSLGAVAGLAVPNAAMGQSGESEAAGLRIAGPAFSVTTLDPALARDLPTQMIARQVFRGLLKFDGDLQPVPDLAASVESAPDAKRYIFTLREDAVFSSGDPITSDKVAASLTRALRPETARLAGGSLAAVAYLQDIRGAAGVLGEEAGDVAGMKVIDDRTLAIELEAPSSTFLSRIAHVSTSIVDVSETRDAPRTWWQTPNASGPYRVAAYSGSEIRLERNPAYQVSPAKMSPLVFLTGVAASNPFNLYQQDAVDLVPVSDAQAGRLAEDPASEIVAKVFRTPAFATGYIALGNQQSPLDDVHVRRALQRLIAPDSLAVTTFGGGVIPATGLIPPGMLGRDWQGGIASPDVADAAGELAQSRFGGGAAVPPISIHAADIEPVEALRDVALAELDLRIEAIAVNWNDFLDGLAERRFAAYSLYWGADYPDPAAFLDLLFHSAAADNYTGYRNLALDAILETAREELDVSRRAELYEMAQAELLDDGGVIPLYHDVTVSLVRPNLQGVDLTPMGLLYMEDAVET